MEGSIDHEETLESFKEELQAHLRAGRKLLDEKAVSSASDYAKWFNEHKELDKRIGRYKEQLSMTALLSTFNIMAGSVDARRKKELQEDSVDESLRSSLGTDDDDLTATEII